MTKIAKKSWGPFAVSYVLPKPKAQDILTATPSPTK
jgi:hypothetical protein